MTSILKVDTIQDTAGNNIINESSDTITIGASGDTVNIVGTLQNNGSGLVSGITMADQWRISATYTKSGAGASDITANWERNDTTYSTIGTGITESSGVFSFPSTGIYLVEASASIYAFGDARPYGGILLQATTDNSNYSSIARGYEGMYANDTYGNINVKAMFDVTNITTHKIKLTAESSDSVRYEGSTSENKNYLTFIRLGDT